MAEALGVAAGALGIASFGIQLAESIVKLKRFCGEVKGVPRKLHRLTEELEIMTEALSTFTVDYEKLLATRNPVRKSLGLCEAAVKDLASTIKTLEDRLSRRKRISSIYAALRREEVDDLVENMERTRNLLDFVSRVYLEAQRQDELSSILVYCRTHSYAASSSTGGTAVSQATADDGCVAQQAIEAVHQPPVPASGTLVRPRVLEYRAFWWLFSQAWELSVERAISAECAGAIDEDQWRAYKHRMAALIATGIQAGSDLHVLSKTGSGMTPLMHALFGAMLYFEGVETVKFDRDVTTIQHRFQRWLTLLAMAGVDLSKYAKREARLFRKHWRTSQRVWWKCFICHCEVIALRFGSTATEWGLWVSHPGDSYSGQFWDMVEHPERSIPGAWMESEEFDPEPSVRRKFCYHRSRYEFELQDSDRARWPDDLDYFED
ncbi:hypothetical protein D0865_04420 [Hortaea werneckii]|uniref:Fungal N-terminal domain-containing protein n=1 Tax=Hortaea werneckii TaxID=91943 RepID=A0A3M7CS88_HORWE|nr:hypothetical protein D0865_04420 [Hortaea werneckii]